MSTQFYNRPSNDLTQLLKSGINYDASIEVGKKAHETDIYKVNSIILKSRSSYFQEVFDENGDQVKFFKPPNISSKVFEVIIKYINSGKISLEKLETSVIFDLLITSSELELDELFEHLQIHLINNCASWLKLNFVRVFRTSHQFKNLEIVKEFCNNIIFKHPNTIFESDYFHSLPKEALISILQRDDLQLEESKIWEYIIEWGKAKNPNLPANLDEWTNDNFLTLKEALKECLPYIRYFSFSHEDIIKKLIPYEQLLETQLWSDINARLISPESPISTIELPPRIILNKILPPRNILPSNIITNEQALKISSWIGLSDRYKFKLLVRGSRDGFDVKTIYNICDKVSKTIIILKVKGTEEILGGYNPLYWDNNKNKTKSTQNSFIFSLENANRNYSIFSRVIRNSDKAIYNYPKESALGFSVGLCLRGDLQRCYCKFNQSYDRLIRPAEFTASIIPSKKELFSVEEYEVFKISPIIRE